MRKLLLAFFPFMLFACTHDPGNNQTGQVEGYAPVYASSTDITKINFGASRKTGQAGKIYAFRNYIFQNEINKGIHVINNSDRSHPVKLAFIEIPYSTEISVKGNFLYSNNLSDLVVFDIANPDKPLLVKRIANVFPPVNQQYPPVFNSSFECVDPAKGIVVSWERKLLNAPQCRR